MDKKKLIIGGVIAFFVIGGIIAAITGNTTENQKDKGGVKKEKKDESSYQDAVELKCEDAATVELFANAKNYSIRIVGDSWDQYTGSTGNYTKDGDELVNYRWHGKDKTTNETVTFDCWVAGKEDNLAIYGYSIGDQVFKDWTSVEWYNKDGSKQED